jgi:hypothetical protein
LLSCFPAIFGHISTLDLRSLSIMLVSCSILVNRPGAYASTPEFKVFAGQDLVRVFDETSFDQREFAVLHQGVRRCVEGGDVTMQTHLVTVITNLGFLTVVLVPESYIPLLRNTAEHIDVEA